MILTYSLIICLTAAFGISWFRFFQAATNPGLLYLPLESYFFTASYSEGSKFYNRPDFFISNFNYKVPGIEKLTNEIFIWIFIILVVLVFLQLMSCNEWFVVKSPKNNIKVPILGKYATRLCAQLQNKNNIFNFDFQQITLIAFSTAAILLFLIPNDSSDIYGYIARGAQQSLYGMNPYHQTVSEITNWWDQPLFANLDPLWSYNPAPYGPFYMLIYAGIAFLSMGNFYVALFLFKLFNFGLFASLLLLLVRILNDKEFDKEFFEKKFTDNRQIFSYKKIIYSLIALNPFILIEAIWNGHNDLLMGVLILASLYLCFKNKLNLALIVLAFSVSSKYIGLILLPFILIYAFSRGWKNFPWFGSIASLVITSLTWIYYDPLAVSFYKISDNILLCHKSLQRSFNTIYKLIIGENMPAYANFIFLAIFVLCLIFLYYKFAKTENKKLNIFHFSFLAMFLLIFVFSAKFHSWYLLMVLPFAVIIHPRFMLLLSISHLVSLTFLDQANLANFLIMTAIPSIIYFKYLLKQDL